MAEPIRLGLLRLCDAAPVILADQEEMFAMSGLRVTLSIEPSWANIADKLGYRLLDGAVMLPPLAIACAAGLRRQKTELAVPMSLSANGNAITLAARHQAAFYAGGISGVGDGHKLRLAVVHGYSTHDLLLRTWLAEAGLAPEQDVEIAVIPPAEMVGSLAAGAIDGFCAGAPWGEVASHAGLGFIAARSRDIWPNHPEKCLALHGDFVRCDEAAVVTLLTVLRRASALCAASDKRAALANLLAEPEYLDLPPGLIAAGLNPETGGPLFTRQYPSAEDAAWYAQQMVRWGKAPPGIEEIPACLYRPDLFIAAGGEPAAPLPWEFGGAARHI